MALRITFAYVSYAKDGEPLSSFDLAHITVSGAEGSVSTKDHQSAEMLFLVIVELLHGVRQLLSDTRHKQFTWEGVYGGLSVTFQKTGKGIVVTSRRRTLATVPHQELAQDVYNSVNYTIEELDVAARLSPSEPIYQDLQTALKDYRQFLTQCS